MYCFNCGQKISQSVQKFCFNCGVALNVDVERGSSKRNSSSTNTAPTVSTQKTFAPLYSGKQQVTYQQAPALEKGALEKHSKNCFLLATISFVVTSVSLLLGIPLLFILISSLHYEYDLIAIWGYWEYYVYYPWSFPIPERTLVLEDGMRMVAGVYGVLFIIIGILTFILGIVARSVRRKAIHHESYNTLVKIAGVFSILSIIFSIAGAILGACFSYIPYYVTALGSNNLIYKLMLIHGL